MEGVRLARESSDGTKVDNVARHLRVHHLLDVHADLEVVTSARCAEVLDTSNLVGETDASGALNAAEKEGKGEGVKKGEDVSGTLSGPTGSSTS